MKIRTITAAVLVAIAIPILVFSEYLIYPIALAILAAIAVFELLRVMGAEKKYLVSVPAYIISLLLPLMSYYFTRESRLEYLLFVSVGELDLSLRADDELFSFVRREIFTSVGGEGDAERIHMPVRLAFCERHACIAESIEVLARVTFARCARDDRIRLELVIHERSETLTERTGNLGQNAQCRKHFVLLDCVDDIFIYATLLRKVAHCHIQALAKRTYATSYGYLFTHCFILSIL